MKNDRILETVIEETVDDVTGKLNLVQEYDDRLKYTVEIRRCDAVAGYAEYRSKETAIENFWKKLERFSGKKKLAVRG